MKNPINFKLGDKCYIVYASPQRRGTFVGQVLKITEDHNYECLINVNDEQIIKSFNKFGEELGREKTYRLSDRKFRYVEKTVEPKIIKTEVIKEHEPINQKIEIEKPTEELQKPKTKSKKKKSRKANTELTNSEN